MLKVITNILPKNFVPSLLGFCFVIMWSPNNAQNVEKQEDSLVSKIETTEIKDDPQAAAIDQKWFDLLSDTYRFQEQQHALNDPWDSIPLHDSLWSTDTFKSRLALPDQKTPFHITYNASLEKLVRNYLKTDVYSLSDLWGKSLLFSYVRGGLRSVWLAVRNEVSGHRRVRFGSHSNLSCWRQRIVAIHVSNGKNV